MNRIKKAVFPVAGLGSRFLPATKAQPKEMLPIVDKPLIQYAVEEAVAAGITEMIFITGRNKRAIEDHFDKDCGAKLGYLKATTAIGLKHPETGAAYRAFLQQVHSEMGAP
jgi:UTP-glucose-1-phosphate uridylyltransferase